MTKNNHHRRWSSQGRSYTERFTLPLALLTVLIWAGILAPVQAAPGPDIQRQTSGERLVLAHYYTWFDEMTWSRGGLSDLPAQSYASRDRAAMGRHIEQARSAGIDGLLVAWYGPGGENNQTESNLAAMLEEANARGFRIGILFETTSPFISSPEATAAALSHALSVHAAQPGFLRSGGRPVIFFWRPQRWSVETWQGIRQQVDPNHNTIWIAEGVEMAYQAVFDGHHLYSNTWNPPADLTYTNQKFARWVADARQLYGGYRYWVATVMPGYNDLGTGRGNAFARDRAGGAYYEEAWRAAIASNPDWIVITSFNEWPEGSQIEPSVSYGDLYLRLTGAGSAQFKNGITGNAPEFRQAAAAEIAPPPPPPVQPPSPPPPPTEVSGPTAYILASLLNLRGLPDTHSPVLDMLPVGAAVPILGRHPDWPEWWMVEYAGQIGWIFAEYVQPLGPLDQVPIAWPADTQASPLTALPAVGFHLSTEGPILAR